MLGVADKEGEGGGEDEDEEEDDGAELDSENGSLRFGRLLYQL